MESPPSWGLEQGWLVWGLLILFLLLGAALRLYGLDDKALWYDELGTALYTAPDKPLLEVVRGPLEMPVIPALPLYFLTTHIFRQVSEGEFLLRLPSVFYGLLAIAAIYILGKALLGPREALIGAFLLTISPFHIRYSQEARYYALLLLLATLSLYFFYQGLRRNDRLSWLGYIVCSTLALYTHLFAFLFLVVEGVFALVWFAERFLRARPSTVGGGKRWWRGAEPVISFLLSALVMAFLYLPMVPYTLGGLLSRKGLGGHIPTTINRGSLSYLAGIVDLLGAGPGVALFCYLLALGLGLYFMGRRDRQQLALAGLWITLPFLVVFFVPAGHNFRLRYVIFVLPLFLLIASAGLVGLSEAISRWLAKWVQGEKALTVIGPTSLAAACVFFGAFSLGSLQRYWSEGKQPWDKAAAFLQSVAGLGETVITLNEAHAQRLLYYGYNASEVVYLVPCPCPATPKMEDWYSFPELAASDGQAWFLEPSPNYERLMPGGPLAEELEGYLFLPPIIFKGHTTSNIVEKDLLGPYMTSDAGVLPVLQRDSGLTNEQIIEFGSLLVGQAEELYPGETRSQYTLGELHRFYGSEDEAMAHYEAAIADDPRYYPAYKGLALTYITRGEVRRAVELFGTLTEKGLIRESDYHFLLGSVHIAEQDLDEAIAEFTLAVRLAPDNVDYRLWLGDAYYATTRFDEAMTQYNEVTRLDPSYAPAYACRGKAYRAQGRLAEAAAEYQAAVKLWPNNPLYHALLAEVYGQQGLLEQALAEAKEAARLGRGGAAYHDLLGQIYLALDRLAEAIAEGEEAVRLAPSIVSYRLNLADAYRLAGRDGEAITAYERVLELDPGNAMATRRLEELR